MNKSILCLLLFLLLIAAKTQSAGYLFIGDLKNYTQQQNIITFQCTNAQVQIIILADDLFRIKMTNNKAFPEDYSYSVLAIKKSPPVAPIIDEGDKIKLLSSELILMVNKSPFRLAFYDDKGNLICKDHEAYGMGWNGTKVCCWKELHDELFYGLGEKTRGFNKRGDVYTMWNSDIPGYTSVQDPLYQSHPFFLSLYQGRGFGIYFDNSYRSQFNLGAGNDQFFSFGAHDGLMDYYFIYGPSLKKVLERYGELVGVMPLPPKWSLGYQQCRWSYYPEGEVMALANKFRDKEIPCDVIYLDIHYMDGYRVFTWHPERFPQSKKMLDELKKLGFRIAVIIDPGIKVDPNYWVYQEGIKGDYFCKYPDGSRYRGQVWPGWCYFPDFSKPEASAWFGSLYKGIIEDGIMGFWNDMNEPATWGGTFPDIVQFDNEGRDADHLKMHNLYGFLMAKTTYGGVKKLRPEQRPFVLTRAGFSGVQRYSAVWTGDNVASWEHLKLSINMCLGLGMSGVAFCGTDIGGFMGAPTPDLYTRWIQLGTFTPLFRTHTCINTPDQEPWSFGDGHEAINKKFIQLRYQLLPYIYDAFHESSLHNTPIMRPMIYEYQDDPSVTNMDDQFMFGDDLLIAPVFQENQTARMVYFPVGEWYDFWTDEKILGPLEKRVDAPLDKIPIFVKGGAIVPMQEAMQYVDQNEIDPLILHIYPKQGLNLDSLYEDDGIGFDYEKGVYSITTFELTIDQDKISFITNRKPGNYLVARRNFLTKIHSIKLVPRNVEVNGEKLKKITSKDQLGKSDSGWYYESESKVLDLKYPDTGKRMKVEVNF